MTKKLVHAPNDSKRFYESQRSHSSYSACLDKFSVITFHLTQVGSKLDEIPKQRQIHDFVAQNSHSNVYWSLRLVICRSTQVFYYPSNLVTPIDLISTVDNYFFFIRMQKLLSGRHDCWPGPKRIFMRCHGVEKKCSGAVQWLKQHLRATNKLFQSLNRFRSRCFTVF